MRVDVIIMGMITCCISAVVFLFKTFTTIGQEHAVFLGLITIAIYVIAAALIFLGGTL
jgi:hypothetical protein